MIARVARVLGKLVAVLLAMLVVVGWCGSAQADAPVNPPAGPRSLRELAALDQDLGLR